MRAYSAIFATPFAALGIVIDNGRVSAIDFLPGATPAQPPRDNLSREVGHQLEHYLQDPRFRFDLPLAMPGTAFQRRVWAGIAAIPDGATLTYAGLAEQVGSGARAVANACGANPIALVVPCHRVVASHGLGGFMGGRRADSLDIKRWLLAHEGVL
jgi:methylated-DNA-[protein]-cysteine S-methyltransferase